MNRRFVIIAVVGIIILALVGGALFWAVQKQKAAQEPVATGPVLLALSTESAISPVASLDGNGIWFFNSDNRLFRINADGTGLTEFPLPTLSNQKITRVLWPPSGENLDFLAVTTKDPIITGKVYYNSLLKTYTNLPDNIQSIDWLPDSKRVVYVWQSADKQTQQLITANADSAGFVAISNVFYPDLVVEASSDGKTVLLYRSKIEGAVNKIYAADLSTKEITTVIDQGKNLEALWISPTRFLFTQEAITSYPSVYLYDMISRQAVSLAINTTLDKVVVSGDGKTLYAATPKKDNTGDTFVKVDLVTFKNEDYLLPEQNVRAKNLVLLGSSVFFVNTTDGKLYGVEK